MPSVDGVLFDYGHTLVTFDYPSVELSGVVERFRPAIAAATGRPAPAAEEILRTVLLPLEALVESQSEDEVRYLDVYARAWRDAGLDLPDELLYEMLDAEQLVWDHSARVESEAVQVLSWLAAQGVKRAICSNAPFPPEMMLRQVDGNGIGALVDGVVFSSQVGKRKPAREMYVAALQAIDVEPERALFVGDRLREDYEGPRAVGMRAVVCTAHAAVAPANGVPTIGSLRELPSVL